MYIDGNTICQDCAFKEMDGLTQIGCKAGALEQYRKNGEKIVEAYNDESGEEKEFYVIENKICPWYRGGAWYVKNNSDLDTAKKEILGRMLDIVIYIDDPRVNFTDAISHIKHQTLNPSKLHVVVRDSNHTAYHYISKLDKLQLGYTYIFHHITNPDMSKGDCLNMVGDKCESFYYAVFYNEFFISNNFVERVYERTYRQMKPFVLLLVKSEYDSGIIINTQAHKALYGNDRKRTIVEKIVEQATEQNLLDKIIDYRDLYAE